MSDQPRIEGRPGESPEEFLERLRLAWVNAPHSLYGASGAHRYLHCPGSLIANALGEDTAGYDAAYGTVAHDLSEQWLRTNVRPDDMIGQTVIIKNGNQQFAIEIDDAMLAYIEENFRELEYISGRRWVEERVDFSILTPIPDQGGKADFVAILDDGRTMIVYDHKYGQIPVYAEWNEQLLLYAFGALRKFDRDGTVRRIVIRIGQPRIDNQDEWVISRDDLLLWAGEQKPKMYACWSLDAPRVAGDQCTFCRARSTCPAYAKMQTDTFAGLYEPVPGALTPAEMRQYAMAIDRDEIIPVDFDPKQPLPSLTVQQMEKLYPLRKLADRFWKALETELKLLTAQGKTSRYKLVSGRTKRGWRDPQTVAEAMEFEGLDEDQIWVRQLRSPKQMEIQLRTVKVRPKDFPRIIDPLVHASPGNPSLAPIDDPRPALADTSYLYQPVSEDDDDSDDEL